MATDAPTLSRPGRLTRASAPRPAAIDVVLVAGLALAACGLRATQLHQSLFGDEVLAFREIAGHTLGGTVRAVGTGVESSPPLFFVLAWLSAKLGDPTVWVRLPSLVLSTLTVPVIYALGRETVGRQAALVAAAITAASPFATYYGIEARPYATTEFCVALSTLALTRAVRSGRRGEWVLYALATAAAAYSHYTAIFVLLTQAGWAGWVCRGRLRPVLFAHAGAAVLYLPWLPSLHGSDLGAYALLEPLTAGHVVRDVLHPVLGYAYTSLRVIPTTLGLVLVVACGAAGALTAALRPRGRALPRPRSRADHVLLGLLAVATPVGLLLYSVLLTDLWSPRSLISSAPAQTLVLAAALVALPRAARALAIVATLAVLVFATGRAITPRYARPPYRAIAALLDRTAAPGAPVILPTEPFVLDAAIPAQFHRPHRVIGEAVTRWPHRPAGSLAYVVYDDSALAFVAAALHPQGWTRISARHWHGLVDLTLLVYRARRAG